MTKLKSSLTIVFASIVFLYCPTDLSAAPITASELIEDVEPLELHARDLTRTRSDSNGFLSTITNDPTIVSENLISPAFGFYNPTNVSYRHILTWLNPASVSFISMVLEIKAYGVDGDNDVVFADTLNLGHLVSDGLILEGFTTTLFLNNNSSALNLILADGFLNILIDKNLGATGLPRADASSIYSSKLTVDYNPVPEPLSVVLLGSALGGLGIARKKKLA